MCLQHHNVRHRYGCCRVVIKLVLEKALSGCVCEGSLREDMEEEEEQRSTSRCSPGEGLVSGLARAGGRPRADTNCCACLLGLFDACRSCIVPLGVSWFGPLFGFVFRVLHKAWQGSSIFPYAVRAFSLNAADCDHSADVSDLVQGNMSAAAKDAMRMCGSTLIDSPCLVKCCSKFNAAFLISPLRPQLSRFVCLGWYQRRPCLG